MSDRTTTPVRVDRALNRRLRAAAADRDVSAAWLANRLIAEGLDNLLEDVSLTATTPEGGATDEG